MIPTNEKIPKEVADKYKYMNDLEKYRMLCRRCTTFERSMRIVIKKYGHKSRNKYRIIIPQTTKSDKTHYPSEKFHNKFEAGEIIGRLYRGL
jgi:hypothetical protein